MVWIVILSVLLSGCASALWVRNDEGKMELQKVMLSTGPAKVDDAENKAPFPPIFTRTP